MIFIDVKGRWYLTFTVCDMNRMSYSIIYFIFFFLWNQTPIQATNNVMKMNSREKKTTKSWFKTAISKFSDINGFVQYWKCEQNKHFYSKMCPINVGCWMGLRVGYRKTKLRIIKSTITIANVPIVRYQRRDAYVSQCKCTHKVIAKIVVKAILSDSGL